MFVGIVGRSGSGKVPFLSCYSDFTYRVRSHPDRRLRYQSADLASLRQQIGWFSGRFSFNGSILANITLGNPDITSEQVVAAATAVV